MRNSAGYSLLEVMIVVSILLLLSAFSIPTINNWVADNKFRSALLAVTELAKAGRLQAISTSSETHLIVNGKGEECVAISTSSSCSCSLSSKPSLLLLSKNQCSTNDEVRTVQLTNEHIDVTTSSGDNKVVTFNKSGTLNFSSSTTIILRDKQRTGRIIISSLGRARSCATPYLSGVSKCV